MAAIEQDRTPWLERSTRVSAIAMDRFLFPLLRKPHRDKFWTGLVLMLPTLGLWCINLLVVAAVRISYQWIRGRLK
jgi:hypothetical protein